MPKRVPLEPTDILFLVGETRQQPMHVGSLMIYKVDEGEDACEVATRNIAMMQSYTKASPPFNYRLARPWLPYWEEDAEFDISNHVRHVKLPHPGEIKDLLKMVGVFHGVTMDRSLPLWYLWVISGLPDNRFAAYVQIHHSLLDGVAGARMIVRSHTTDPAQREMPPFWAMPAKAKKPKPGGKDKDDDDDDDDDDLSIDPFSTAVGLVRSNRNILRALSEAWKNERISTFQSDLFGAPSTIFNQSITGSRRFAADSFSLSRIKAVGKRVDATVNDVLLAMIGRALQHYLQDISELPDKSLRVLLPVNLREDNSTGGNQIAFVRVEAGTQHHDINELLAAAKASVNAQKKLFKNLSKSEKQLYTAISLGPLGVNIVTGKLEGFKTANIMLSNIPGPKETLYWNGQQLDAMYPVSIPLQQMAVNFTVFSYRDNIELGIIGGRRRVPHMQKLLQYMHDALAELEAANP
jgi:diacylglycerol O-acyltransferase